MYQIAEAYAAIPPTEAVRGALQIHFFPSNLRIDKLPIPDNDRDMMAMRLESLQANLVRLSGIIEKTGPEGYKDPATGNVVDIDYLGMRLLSAVKEVQLLTMYLALNDAWRARDIKPVPKSAAIDLAAQEAVVEGHAMALVSAQAAVDEMPVEAAQVYAED
jgi:hypothetical protein